MKNQFEQVAANDLKNGFIYNDSTKTFSCLFCNAEYEDGDIYKFENRLTDANKAIKLHIQEKHQSTFEALLTTDKKQTGLTDIQKNILLSFYNGKSDKEIAEETDTSPSTVRYQRHNFREKARQSKIILAISELLEEQIEKNDIVETKTDSFFESFSPLVLKTFSVKKKNQLIILKIISQQFESKKKYTEKQVNEILKPIYQDYVALRRALIDFCFMKRSSNGEEYWLNI